MAENTTGISGQDYPGDGSLRVVACEDRALLRITSSDANAEAILDRDAVVTGSWDGGYTVTAPWAVNQGQPVTWFSGPSSSLTLGKANLSVSTSVLIEACLAAPSRTVRIADLPQLHVAR